MNRTELVQTITNRAAAYGIPPAVAVAVAMQESGLNANVKDGAAGEIGLYQVKPSTARDFGYTAASLRDPGTNVDAGLRYLSWLMGQTGQDMRAALQAYNGGIGNWMKGTTTAAAKSYADSVLQRAGAIETARLNTGAISPYAQTGGWELAPEIIAGLAIGLTLLVLVSG